MDEDCSNGSNSEPLSSDERMSGRKKNGRNSSSKRKAEPTFVLSPSEPKYLRSDDSNSRNSLTRGVENCIYVPRDKVVTSIKEIVRKGENNKIGSEIFNGFNRIQFARNEEMTGHIQIHVVSNSCTNRVSDENLIKLVTYRNLIAHELPRMNKRYITRLVFCPKHENLVLIKGGVLIGGICFRRFPDRDFSEIVFLAIASNQHVKGYGTHMLNHLKDYHLKKNVHYLLTCADEEAFGYFEKQGFTSSITLDKSVYTGYIKFYHPATLMECKLDNRITYTNLPDIVSRNKMILTQLIKKYLPNKEVSDEKKTETNNKDSGKK